MCQPERAKSRWIQHRREGAVVLLVAAIAIAIAVLAHVRAKDQRRLKCVRDLRLNGGVVFSTSWLENIRSWRAGLGWNSDTGVLLEKHIDSEWFAERGFLSELSITGLAVDGNYLDATTVIQLIERHPIKSLSANCQSGADAVADAIAHDPELNSVSLRGSDLTDAGFRRLPLERLENLALAESQVTSKALTEDLHRCHRLTVIDLDGNQLDSDIAQLLAELPSLNFIVLFGRSITDDHLRLIEAVDRPMRLNLYATSVSSGAVSEFQRSRPKVTVYVIDQTPPPCPGT